MTPEVTVPSSGANGRTMEPVARADGNGNSNGNGKAVAVAHRPSDEPVIFRAWWLRKLFRLTDRVDLSRVLKTVPERDAPPFIKNNHARLCDLLKARGVQGIYTAMRALLTRAEKAERMTRAKADEWWNGFVLPLANGCQVVANVELRREIGTLVKMLNHREAAYGLAEEVETEIRKHQEELRAMEQRRLDEAGSFLDDIIGEEEKPAEKIEAQQGPTVAPVAIAEAPSNEIAHKPVEGTEERDGTQEQVADAISRLVGTDNPFVCMMHTRGMWWLKRRNTCQLNRKVGGLLLVVVPEDHMARKNAEEIAKVASEGWTFCPWDGQNILLVDLQRILGTPGLRTDSEEYHRLRQICPEKGGHRVFGPMDRSSEAAETARQAAEKNVAQDRLFAIAIKDPAPQEGDSAELAALKRNVRARQGGAFAKKADDESIESAKAKPATVEASPPKEPVPCSCGRGPVKTRYGKCTECLKEARVAKSKAAASKPKSKDKKGGKKK